MLLFELLERDGIISTFVYKAVFNILPLSAEPL